MTAARRNKKNKEQKQKPHAFRNKLLLNQFLLSQFGIDPLREHTLDGKQVRPFHILADILGDPSLEGLNHDNLHNFYHALVNSELHWTGQSKISKGQLLVYEENIVRHTLAINEKRHRPVVWKYYQWLTILFVEIYLDRFFQNRETLLNDLNDYVRKFNKHWTDFQDMPFFAEDDLNKICLQNATGSGKTLLMHVNLLQYRLYAQKHGKDKDLSRVILLTPNERLSEQHITEFVESNIQAGNYLQERGGLFGFARGLQRVDVLEITKLADQEGVNTVATRSFGDQNLLLVDEGHRGISGQDDGAWFTRRTELCAKGFTFEYSATFEQAVQASRNSDFEDAYAKVVLFDYSYRWFYEDGFGKDYKIDNLPHPDKEAIKRLVDKGSIKSASRLANDRAIAEAMLPTFLTASLLKFYQQLRIYEERSRDFQAFKIEKPLWVFVGNTVSGKKTKEEIAAVSDVAQIVLFLADFLTDQKNVVRRINEILTGTGQDTGLVDKNGKEIFEGAFRYLLRDTDASVNAEAIYQDILARLFNQPSGGQLSLERVKGDSGEVALKVGNSKSLCDHLAEVAARQQIPLIVEDSNFTEAMFASVKDSSSPVNILLGSKKFVEGWDCWRVSTMGLMHVGKSEGSQIVQLFGRGIRLKGYEWSLKRSGHSGATVRPEFIEELETLNVFGIAANFMEKFRDFLKDEGLPGNERRRTIFVPLNITHDFGKRLKVLRPRNKKDGTQYSFKKDAKVPTLGEIPDYLTKNKVVVDWYPRIQAIHSREEASKIYKDRAETLREEHLALFDYDAIFFELEKSKRERGWHNFNITKDGIKSLLKDTTWYTLYIPSARMKPTNFDGVRLLQQVATELLKRYADRYYNYSKQSFDKPRLVLQELTLGDENIPKEDSYQLMVDGDEDQVINAIHQIQKEIQENKEDLLKVGDLEACQFSKHLFQPLFHVRRGGKVKIAPVALNESEFRFVTDLKRWCDAHEGELNANGTELFLLRNLSRGKGIGFFEAGNFHPDFILWILVCYKQFVTFIEPHGLMHEGPGSEKVQLHKRIKEVEERLGDPQVILNSFILSWTQFPQLKWDQTQDELEKLHVLFMTDDRDGYIDKLFAAIRPGLLL